MTRDIWQNSSFHTSKSQEDFLASYQPGGTATIICDRWASRVVSKGADPLGLGWWNYVVLPGKGTKKIFIINAYNPRPASGDTTVYQQHVHLLSALYHHRQKKSPPNPHRQFFLDLQAWLEPIQADGHAIILSINANETYNLDVRSPSNSLPPLDSTPTIDRHHVGKLATLIATCNLHDPLALHHPDRPFPASHQCSGSLPFNSRYFTAITDCTMSTLMGSPYLLILLMTFLTRFYDFSDFRIPGWYKNTRKPCIRNWSTTRSMRNASHFILLQLEVIGLLTIPWSINY